MNPIRIEIGQVFWKSSGIRPYIVTEIIDLNPGPHQEYSAKIKLKSAMKRHTEYIFIKKSHNVLSISELARQGFWHTLSDVDTAKKNL